MLNLWSEVKPFSRISSSVKCRWLRQPYHIGVQTKAENFRNDPKAILNLYGVSFICTNFEAFTTFSAIFKCVHRTMVITPSSGHHIAKNLQLKIPLSMVFPDGAKGNPPPRLYLPLSQPCYPIKISREKKENNSLLLLNKDISLKILYYSDNVYTLRIGHTTDWFSLGTGAFVHASPPSIHCGLLMNPYWNRYIAESTVKTKTQTQFGPIQITAEPRCDWARQSLGDLWQRMREDISTRM